MYAFISVFEVQNKVVDGYDEIYSCYYRRIDENPCSVPLYEITLRMTVIQSAITFLLLVKTLYFSSKFAYNFYFQLIFNLSEMTPFIFIVPLPIEINLLYKYKHIWYAH